MNTVLETAKMMAQSYSERATVPRAIWKNGRVVAISCRAIDTTIAPIKYLLLKRPILKTDLSSDRQLRALKIWNMARVVKPRV